MGELCLSMQESDPVQVVQIELVQDFLDIQYFLVDISLLQFDRNALYIFIFVLF